MSELNSISGTVLVSKLQYLQAQGLPTGLGPIPKPQLQWPQIHRPPKAAELQQADISDHHLTEMS